MSIDFELTALEKDFVDAIARRRLADVDACLEKGVSLHFVAGYFEERPLHLAAQANAPEIIARLVEKGARVDVLDQQGQTPLFHAADKNAADAALILLQLEANPNHVAYTGRTAIFGAASRGFSEVIDVLTGNGADANFPVNGATALFWAVNNSHYDAALALVRGGARVDFRNERGMTAGEVAQQKNSDYRPDRLLVQFLNAAHLEGAATTGTENHLTVRKPLSFKPSK